MLLQVHQITWIADLLLNKQFYLLLFPFNWYWYDVKSRSLKNCSRWKMTLHEYSIFKFVRVLFDYTDNLAAWFRRTVTFLLAASVPLPFFSILPPNVPTHLRTFQHCLSAINAEVFVLTHCQPLLFLPTSKFPRTNLSRRADGKITRVHKGRVYLAAPPLLPYPRPRLFTSACILCVRPATLIYWHFHLLCRANV